jgi:hypothetical protein
MGGGKPSEPAPPPAPPSTQETSAQAIQAQIDALPKILAAQQQYGGQFSEEQLKSLQQYGPQFAQTALDLQKTYGPQFADVERSLSPELAGAQKTLADFLNSSDDQEYNALKPGLLEDIRSAQSQRGIGAISPLGSIDESVQLQRLKQSLKDRRLNVALSTAGRVPIGQMPTVQGQTGTGQLVQNVNPQSIFGYQQSLNDFNANIFGTQANIYGTQYNNMTARRGQNMSMISDIIGGGAAAGGQIGSSMILAGAMGCWVASEIFGGWMHPKTVGARIYVNLLAPSWFKEMYLKHGEAMARFISNKPWLKRLLKPLFEKFSVAGWRYLNG